MLFRSPPLIFKKHFNWPVKTSMYIMDAAIMLAQLPFIETDRVLYGIVSAYLFTLMIDRVLVFGDKRYEVTVITERYESLRELLLEHDFGLTMFLGETGLKRQPVKEINAMIRSSQLRELNRLIKSVDDNHVSIGATAVPHEEIIEGVVRAKLDRKSVV